MADRNKDPLIETLNSVRCTNFKKSSVRKLTPPDEQWLREHGMEIRRFHETEEFHVIEKAWQ